MIVIPCGTRPSERGAADHFTGCVRKDPVTDPADPARVRAIIVTFEPGARTHWHTHPLGQTLFVTAGRGLVGSWGGQLAEIRAGDVVLFKPNEIHWHGAAPDTAMVHLAIQVADAGDDDVNWLEGVTDEQYRGR